MRPFHLYFCKAECLKLDVKSPSLYWNYLQPIKLDANNNQAAECVISFENQMF
jgi:hypothetical protein